MDSQEDQDHLDLMGNRVRRETKGNKVNKGLLDLVDCQEIR
jgi:hypothetical protein